MTARTKVIASLCLAMTLAACGSGSRSSYDDGTGGTNPSLMPSFESIQALIFDPLCTSCHVGATAPLGLRLDNANSYGLLVGVASAQEPGLLRVDPGNPNGSYLIRKLEGTAGTGGRMPLGATPLPAADIAMIRQWILDGALPPMGDSPTDPIRVSSLSPLPDSSVPMVPMSVMAMFDRELDATSIDATTFLVERSGGDGTFDDGNEVAIIPVSVSVLSSNPRTAVFDMSTSPLVSDQYRITLVGTGPATIRDLDSNRLDGEFAGVFPSGDGSAGGNFVAGFEVVGIQPTLTSIQDNVFTPMCAGCHTGPAGGPLPGGLDLTSLSASFMSLVNVTSLQDAAFDRVEPGDADASYLVQKLEGTASQGGRMPLFGTPLDQDTIDTIRQWITDGAEM